MHRRNAIKKGLFLSLLLVLASALFITTAFHHTAQAVATTPVAWPAFNGGGQRTGVNTAETTITSSNVGSLKQLWHVTLPATVDGAVAELPNVTTATGTKTLLFTVNEAESPALSSRG